MPNTLGDTGEKQAIEALIQLFDPEGKFRLGDDCAIIDMGTEYLLVTTDMVNQETHVPEGTGGRLLGWYAAAINLSDIASMGGFPLGMLFAMGLPKALDTEYLADISKGMKDCCEQNGAKVLGGDLKENPTISISGTAIGLVGKNEIMLRNGARPGDKVFLTGRLGNQLAWYESPDAHNLEPLLKITPRLKEGQSLAQSGVVTSCIDLSDGLSTSLHHLAKASNVGFEVETESISFISGLSDADKEKCLHLGGEFELLFTAGPRAASVLGNMVSGTQISVIGEVVDGPEITIIKNGQRSVLEDRGYEHFR